jgi:curli biogenesis system outer membrane secretion channel CsgG
VAVAALEPHFAARLAEVAGIKAAKSGQDLMILASTHLKLSEFFAGLTRKQIERIAKEKDLPLLTMA